MKNKGAGQHKTESASSPRWNSELFILKAKTRNDLIRSLDALVDSATKWSAAQESNRDALRTLAYWTYLKQIERNSESHEGKDSTKNSRTDLLTISIVANSLEDLCEKIARAKTDLGDSTRTELRDPRGVYFVDTHDEQKAKLVSGKVAYLFSGQGSQHVDMIKDSGHRVRRSSSNL